METALDAQLRTIMLFQVALLLSPSHKKDKKPHTPIITTDVADRMYKVLLPKREISWTSVVVGVSTREEREPSVFGTTV
jgi:hypothetical protein